MKKNGFKDCYLKKNQPLNSLFDSNKLNQKVNYYDLLLERIN